MLSDLTVLPFVFFQVGVVMENGRHMDWSGFMDGCEIGEQEDAWKMLYLSIRRCRELWLGLCKNLF